MGVLDQLKQWLFERNLRKRMLARPPRRTAGVAVNLHSAETVGIYFDATDLDERQVVLRFAQQLRDQGKKVSLLGYFAHPVEEAQFAFRAFSRHDLNWAGIPQHADLEAFLAEPVDLFIALQHPSSPVLEYIATLLPAKLKVGPVTPAARGFDLMFDFAPGTNYQAMIRHIQNILKVTNVQAEPATI